MKALRLRARAHITRNWSEYGKEFMKLLEDSGIYEIVEGYFKILRKYNLPTNEEPYYFLSPKERHNIKVSAEMLRRTSEIKPSIWKKTL